MMRTASTKPPVPIRRQRMSCRAVIRSDGTGAVSSASAIMPSCARPSVVPAHTHAAVRVMVDKCHSAAEPRLPCGPNQLGMWIYIWRHVHSAATRAYAANSTCFGASIAQRR